MRNLPGFLFLFVLTGCHAVGESSAAIDQSCGALAQARCQKRASCSNGTSITRAFGDMNTCLQREQLSCMLGINAPDTGNTTALIDQCTAAYASLSCSDFFDNNPPMACAVVGPKNAGAPCTFSGQCQTGFCSGDRTVGCGTCGAPPPAGGSCATSFCGRGQECVPSTQLCQPFGQAGDSCDAGHPCGADLTCSGVMGTCQTTSSTVGATCDAKNPCDGTMGLHCEAMNGNRTCTTTTYAGDGMPCGLVGGGFVGCGAGGSCFTSSGLAEQGQSGTCKAAAADGAACDVVLGPNCLTPARCITKPGGSSGVCTLPDGKMCG